MNRRFAPRTPAARLTYFADGVRVPKRTAVRLVMLTLILGHAVDWDYAAAENELKHASERYPFRALNEKVWSEEQWPKPPKRAR